MSRRVSKPDLLKILSQSRSSATLNRKAPKDPNSGLNAVKSVGYMGTLSTEGSCNERQVSAPSRHPTLLIT